MSDPFQNSRLYGSFCELKRRKVYRVAVGYGVVGWLIIRFAATVLPALTLPVWTGRLVIVLVLAGFPIALVLVWAFYVGSSGIKRTPEPKMSEECPACVPKPTPKYGDARARWPAHLGSNRLFRFNPRVRAPAREIARSPASLATLRRPVIVRAMKFSVAHSAILVLASTLPAWAGNSVVNLSHYDLMRVDFDGMKREGVIGVIHEATYPRFDRDSYYGTRQTAASRAGLLWGAYHFGDATDPVRQAEHYLNVVASNWRGPSLQPSGVLLVLDFEKNGHYPGGTMRVDQAARFVERIKQRTGRYPGIYGSENRLRAVLNARGVSPADKTVLGNCWLWIANYHYQPTASSPWSNWRLWQYTGDGKCELRPRSAYPIRVANIARAERNIFRGSNETLAAWWGEHAWVPAE